MLCRLFGLVISIILTLLTILYVSSRPPLSTPAGPPWWNGMTSEFRWSPESRPLRVVFLGWGTTGDHVPNVALGLELAKRGHDVTVVGMDRYRTLVPDGSRMKYVNLSTEVDNGIKSLAAALNAPGSDSDFIPLSGQYLRDEASKLVPEYLNAARGADVLIGNNFPMMSLAPFTVAEALKVPLFGLTHDVLNIMVNSEVSYDPSVNRITNHGYFQNLLGTRLIWVAVGAIATFGKESPWRQIRSELGLSTSWPVMEALGPRIQAKIPTFCTWDPVLWPLPSDISHHWHATGFFHTADVDTDEDDITDLDRWISKRRKRPLLYFGMSSFDHHNRTLFSEVLLDTALTLDMDVVTLRKTVAENYKFPSDRIKVVDLVDHRSLFPKCTAIIHHGGAGTASQVIRSGRPGVCLPAMPFQQTWGARLVELGAGILLTPDDLVAAWLNSTNALTAAIQQATSPSVVAGAKKLAEHAQKQGGVQQAADLIIDYLATLASTSSTSSSKEL